MSHEGSFDWALPESPIDPPKPLDRATSRLAAVHRRESTLGLNPDEKVNDRYRIEERIGAGGSSLLYRAYDEIRNASVALKVLSPALLNNEAAVASFRQEAELAMRLNHPGILRVFEIITYHESLIIVMELMEGGSLRDLMEKLKPKPLEEKFAQICQLLKTITGTLQYAHEHMVHGDLKPENIGFTKEGAIKIMDFGLSVSQQTWKHESYREAVTQNLSAGTPYYIAPEVLNGTQTVSKSSDLYAVAVIAYEALTGKLPVGLDLPLTLLNPKIPEKLGAAIDATLSADPKERLTDAQRFYQAIDYADVKGLLGPWAIQWRRAKKSKPVQALVIGVCTLLVSAYPLSAWLQSETQRQSDIRQAWIQLDDANSLLADLAAKNGEYKQAADFAQMKLTIEQGLNPEPFDPTTSSLSLIVASNQFLRSSLIWQTLQENLNSSHERIDLRFLLSKAKDELGREELKSFNKTLAVFSKEVHAHEENTELLSAWIKNKRQLETLLSKTTQLANKNERFSIQLAEQALTQGKTAASSGDLKSALQTMAEGFSTLSSEFNEVMEQGENDFYEALGAWEALFKPLPPPQLTLIADPLGLAQRAAELREAGLDTEALDLFQQASSILKSWTLDVTQFRERMHETRPSHLPVVTHQDMEFILIQDKNWCRWEVRIIDIARWLQEDNLLSAQSLAFAREHYSSLRPTSPATGLVQQDAMRFCTWLGYTFDKAGRPAGRLPLAADWEALLEHESTDAELLWGIYPSRTEWFTNHFAEEYGDPRFEEFKLTSLIETAPSPSGLFGLESSVWEWTDSFYRYERNRSFNNELEKRLLVGGNRFGSVAFHAYEPPGPEFTFVLRKAGIGFRPILRRF